MGKAIKEIPVWVWLLILSASLSVAYFIGYDIGYEKAVKNSVNSFQDCVAAGYPVQESYPEVCRTPGGKSFTNT